MQWFYEFVIVLLEQFEITFFIIRSKEAVSIKSPFKHVNYFKNKCTDWPFI